MWSVRRSTAAPILLALALTGIGCASGYVTTSTGAVRPAAEVQSQDVVGDVLHSLSEGYSAAREKHDATPVCSATVPPPCESVETHAKHRKILLASARGLRAGWAGLESWKLSTAAKPPANAFCPLVQAAPDFLGLLFEFGVIDEKGATTARQVLATLAGDCQ